MPFQPGQSGNPGGRPKAKPFRDALMIEAKAAEDGQPCEARPGSLRWNARKLLEQGDVQAIKELADRMDGKVPQGVIGGDEDDPPVALQFIELRAVRANHTGG
jgi:hypothetical protein